MPTTPRDRRSHFITVPMVARMRELRSLGISSAAVGRIVAYDWGLVRPISDGTVRRYAPTGTYGPGRGDVVGVSHTGGLMTKAKA